MSPKKKRRNGERGASAVEFALIAPLLFMLVFGIIDFGLSLSASVQINNAAREGARLAVVDPDPTKVDAAVRAAAAGLDSTKLTVTITCKQSTGPACPGGLTGAKTGDTVSVAVKYIYSVLTPLPIGSGTLTINTSTSMRVE